MSADYDLYMETEDGDVYTDVNFNLTYNYGPMFREADPNFEFGMFDEKHASEMADYLQHIILSQMLDDPERFRVHDAPNGWGTFEQLIPRMVEFIIACRRWPHAKVSAG